MPIRPSLALAALVCALASPLAAPTAAPAQTSAPAVSDQELIRRSLFYDQEVARLDAYRAHLLASNRRWQPPLMAAATGAAALIAGGVVFWRAWSPDGCPGVDGGCDTFNPRMDLAGLVLMPTGALITMVSTGFFAVRAGRASRLARAERALRRLGVGPALSTTSAGLTLSLRH